MASSDTTTPNPPVGPELDRAVAEAIGWSWVTNRFSTQLDAAFSALRATKTAWWDITYQENAYHVAIEVLTEDDLVHSTPYPTLPEAICRAVLAWAAARESGREVTDG